VEVALDARLKRSLELANKTGARQAAIVGYSELPAGSAMLKDMQTGEQRPATFDEIIDA
jgi:histidyl-tRNA synthetase